MNPRKLMLYRFLIACIAFGSLCGLPMRGMGATATWNGGTNSNWSTGANWSTTLAPVAADTAVISDTSTNRTILYDSSSSGFLSTLNFTQTTTGVTNTLSIIKSGSGIGSPSLVVSNGFILGSGNSAAVSQLLLDTSQNQASAAGVNEYFAIGGSGTGTLTITNGGLFTLNSYDYTATIGSNNPSTSYTAYTPTVAGNVNINGGTLIAAAPFTDNTNTVGIGAPGPTITGSINMTSGTLSLNNGDVNSASRLYVSGTVTATGGVFAGNASVVNGNGYLDISGAGTNSITGVTGLATVPILLFGASNQVLIADSVLGTVAVRAPIAGSYTKTIADTASGTNIGLIQFGSSATGATSIFKLGSNLTTVSSPTVVWNSGATNNYGFDLGGYNLTLTGINWTPSANLNATTNTWTVIDSSSTASTLTAASFAFNGLTLMTNQMTIGGSGSVGVVTLQATGTGGNNFGNAIVDPTSRFLYTGTSATLTATNALGKVEVGDGTNASVLTMVSTGLTAAGNVKVNSGSKLDILGKQLTLTNGASLQGKGSIASSSGSSNIVFSSGSTGGISPGGDANTSVTSVGILILVAANGSNFISGVNLASTSVSSFDIASTSSYDIFNLNGTTMNYANSTLTLNFLNGYNPNLNDSFTILQNLGTVTGSFTTINSNIAGDAFSFNAATGVVTVTAAVPEPPPAALAAFAVILLGLLMKGSSRKARA